MFLLPIDFYVIWFELTKTHLNKEVTLSGWVHKSRDKGFMVWIDLRDRYGVSQLIFDEKRTTTIYMTSIEVVIIYRILPFLNI